MYALESKKLLNTQYFVTYYAALSYAKGLGLSNRSFYIRAVH